jgi:hypothetical protein
VTYADPTCNMGNQGSWSDTGTKFCFNPAKTWYNGWYSDRHVTVNPLTNAYSGDIVGINAVNDNTIQSDQDVVLRIQGSGATDHFIMFNRKAGANSQVPGYGDTVLITTQDGNRSTSSWTAALTSGQEYTDATWSGGQLVVKVCSIDLSLSGKASVLVYIDGVTNVSCGGHFSPELKDFGATPPASQLPLQLCEGDCDNDGDCADGLKCFQRTGLTPVPGCSGSGKIDYDYCFFV